MPLYEYQCEKCGDKFEVMQKFADERLSTHDKCGGHVQRLLSVPALQFKGSGFYVNDYAKTDSGSGKPKDGSPKKSDSSEAKSSSGSSESSAGSSTPAAPSSTESKSTSSDSKSTSSDSK